MNYKLHTADEDEDAAFRARLAPLASEVLPGQSALRRELSPKARRRHAIVIGGLSVAVVALAAAATVSRWSDVSGFAPAVPRSGSSERDAAAPPATMLPAPNPAVPASGTGMQAAVVPARPAALPPVAQPAPADDGAANGGGRPEAAAMIDLLSRRGRDALAQGDVIAARLLFERAAGLGSAQAAREAGKTYDIAVLLDIGARGIRADPAAARAWYRKAADHGDSEARTRLESMTRKQGRP